MSLRSISLALAPASALIALPALAASEGVFALSTAPAGAHLSPLADTTPFRVILTLPLQDEAGAQRYGDAVSNPKSALYGHYLTPAQFGARFGANAANYDALRNWAASAGLSVGPRLDSRAEISLGGTAGQFAALFGTHFVSFPTSRGDGYTITATPRLPAALRGKVNGVIGLTSQAKFAALLRKANVHPALGTGLDGSGLAPSDLRKGYDVPDNNAGEIEKIAVFEQSGYQATDITTYEDAYKLRHVPNTVVSVNGAPAGVSNSEVELEADLDLEMLGAINQYLKGIRVYIDGQDSFQVALLDAINQVAQDNMTSVFSISYGQDESLQGLSAIKAENTAFRQLQAQGVTVLVGIGDNGAQGNTGTGLHVADPGTQPLVTSVGGTDLTLNSASYVYIGETVWNDLAAGHGGTGGGVSSVWPIPTWQVVNGVSVAAANGGSSTKRNVPDIAAVADRVHSPISVYSSDNGGWVQAGGTGAAAPIWAGFISIYNEHRSPRLGFLNPKLYSLGEAGTNFHDVTVGGNANPGHAGFKAGKGYDNTTGWGSIDVTKELVPFIE